MEEKKKRNKVYFNGQWIEPLTFEEMVEARVKDFGQLYEEGFEKSPETSRLLKIVWERLPEAIQRYENTTDAKQRYKAKSELGRLSERLNATLHTKGNKVYIAGCERDGNYRVPFVRTIESNLLGPKHVSLKELRDNPAWKAMFVQDEKLLKQYFEVVYKSAKQDSKEKEE